MLCSLRAVWRSGAHRTKGGQGERQSLYKQLIQISSRSTWLIFNINDSKYHVLCFSSHGRESESNLSLYLRPFEQAHRHVCGCFFLRQFYPFIPDEGGVQVILWVGLGWVGGGGSVVPRVGWVRLLSGIESVLYYCAARYPDPTLCVPDEGGV